MKKWHLETIVCPVKKTGKRLKLPEYEGFQAQISSYRKRVCRESAVLVMCRTIGSLLLRLVDCCYCRR